MERALEPELMEDPAQVKAYAEADFSLPHQQFVDAVAEFVANPSFSGNALDLGCGPGDITNRFAQAFPQATIDAVDGSEAMIAYATTMTAPFRDRIRLIHGRLPFVAIPSQCYAIIVSNSLLHHLPDPQFLWQTIKTTAAPGAAVAVMDLLRPETESEAAALVETYAADEPEILRRDFYLSLLAAFTLDEIRAQLQEAGLPFAAEPISDRHVFIKGLVT